MNANQPSLGAEVNTVTAHDDYIEVVWNGAQNAEKVRQTNLEVLAASEELKARGKNLWVYICIQHHPPTVNLRAFHEVLKVFDAVRLERLAVSGDIPEQIMTMVTSVISSFSTVFEVRYFAKPTEALSWLRSGEK